ncbi:radical SAM protein [Desulfovibrio psychrotolerans]|uniref:Radical SAM/SPASM domain-containing protein n=1 Tax=Desulfovibrio psychrotolerans TaxID=415242 RepID=A0A7J0BXW5_9BACT|nr:radical SAM protein [Desulfovibrio psychrotolerans]GFM38546.1 radical SAM/SPASM domain-containing protein [Desulfovibrio psychrotolerans]
MFQSTSPQEWLTDSGLTESGTRARNAYANYVNYMHGLGVPLYKTSRALHLLQSSVYETSEDGYSLPPHTINFCVNNRCNLKCSYCDLSHGRAEEEGSSNTKVLHNVINPRAKLELPLDVCKRVIDESAWYRPTIRIPWMESLLYSQLIPFIEYTKEKNLPFSMLTNGLLLPKFADRLAALEIDALRVSLDGPEAVHDSLCGVKGAYKQITTGLRMLADMRRERGLDMQLGCYFTVNDKNYQHLGAFIDDLDRLGLLDEMFIGVYMFNYISKKMVQMHNEHHAEISGATVEETSAQYVDLSKIEPAVLLKQKAYIEDRYISRGARINFRPDFTAPNLDFCLSDEAGVYPSSRCETHWHTLFINPEGHIKPLPQCILPSLGNVMEHSLLDIWNGKTMREQRITLRKHGAYYGCMRCWSIYSNIEDIQGSWVDNSKTAAK